MEQTHTLSGVKARCVAAIPLMDSKARLTFQEGGNVSELRDAILSVATLLLQLLQAVQELPAGQAGVDAAQLPVHLPPLTATSHQRAVTFQHVLRCSKLTISFYR